MDSLQCAMNVFLPKLVCHLCFVELPLRPKDQAPKFLQVFESFFVIERRSFQMINAVLQEACSIDRNDAGPRHC